MGFSGGCSCGAVRYTISAEPIRGFQCQCRDCQMDFRRRGAAAGGWRCASVVLVQLLEIVAIGA